MSHNCIRLLTFSRMLNPMIRVCTGGGGSICSLKHQHVFSDLPLLVGKHPKFYDKLPVSIFSKDKAAALIVMSHESKYDKIET